MELKAPNTIAREVVKAGWTGEVGLIRAIAQAVTEDRREVAEWLAQYTPLK